MRIVDAGKNGLALEIYHLGARPDGPFDLIVGAHGHDPVPSDANGAANGEEGIHRHNVPVEQHQVAVGRDRHLNQPPKR